MVWNRRRGGGFDELADFLKCKRESIRVDAYEYWSSTSEFHPNLSKIALRILSVEARLVARKHEESS